MGKLQTYFYLGLLGAILLTGTFLVGGLAIRNLVSFARAGGGVLTTSVLLAIVLAGLAFISVTVVALTVALFQGHHVTLAS